MSTTDSPSLHAIYFQQAVRCIVPQFDLSVDIARYGHVFIDGHGRYRMLVLVLSPWSSMFLIPY